MEIRGVTALVTGASGFIGSRLVERLATEEGVRVRAMVRDPLKADRLRKLPVEIIQGDITDRQSLDRATAGCDLVFHCAAIVRETGDRSQFLRVNVEGTRNILQAAVQADVKRFVHFSSVSVYGLNPPEGTNEETAMCPCGNLYCDTKIEAEKAVWECHRKSGLPVVVIRPANVYGPGAGSWTLRPLELIQAGRMILINGGKGLCNYVYIDNLLDAVLTATRRDESVGQIYLLTDGNPVMWKVFFGYYAVFAGRLELRSVPSWLAKTIALIMEILARLSGKQPQITREAIRFLTRRIRFSTEKADRELNFQPRVSLEEGMQLTKQWLKEAGYLGRKTA